MSFINRKERKIPDLNTSSLPDLIFTVLFFFMIVTHMRSVPVNVLFRTPEGNQLTRVTKRASTTYIFIGKPLKQLQATMGDTIVVQVNDRFVPLDQLAEVMKAEKERMEGKDNTEMTVVLKADRDVPVGIVADVKKALREAKTLRVHYSASKNSAPKCEYFGLSLRENIIHIMAQHNLDALDKKILRLIADDARMPFLEVARACNVSGAAIHQRIQKLTNLGVLKGSQFIIDPEKIGYETCAYIGLFLKDPGQFDFVLEELKKIPEVVECHYTTGGFDMFIKIYALNNHHLLNIIHDKLQPLGLSRSETIISFNAAIDRQLPIIDPDSIEE